MTTTTKSIDDLISAIALATDAAQDAEDYDQPGRASKIRAQIRAMETELATLRAAEVVEAPAPVGVTLTEHGTHPDAERTRRPVDVLAGDCPTLRLLDADARGEIPEAVTLVAAWLDAGVVDNRDDLGALQVVAYDAADEVTGAWQWRFPTEGGAYLTPAQRRRARCLRVAIDAAKARRDRPTGRIVLTHGHPTRREFAL